MASSLICDSHARIRQKALQIYGLVTESDYLVIMTSAVEREISRRLDAWNQLKQSRNWPLVTAQEVRDLDLYSGGSGVWVNKTRTKEISPVGVVVGILHTGKHYDDDFDETGILYHYPTTLRKGFRDSNEIEALKNAKTFGIPIFVIRNIGNRKKWNLLGLIISMIP